MHASEIKQIIDDHSDKFARLYDLYEEYNSHTNLSSIRDREGVYAKHFADSLSAYEYIKDAKSLIDIGTGGGFPAIPLAMIFPSLSITAVDSIGKKIKFIELAKNELGLTNLTPICVRAEELAHKPAYRESFDVCVSRAVSELNILLEYCIPFVQLNGLFIAYKKFPIVDEMNKSIKALNTLGAREEAQVQCGEEKQLLIYKKISKSPAKYPRQQAQIKKHPL